MNKPNADAKMIKFVFKYGKKTTILNIMNNRLIKAQKCVQHPNNTRVPRCQALKLHLCKLQRFWVCVCCFYFQCSFCISFMFFFRLFHYLIEKKRRKNNNIQVINGETNEIVNETHKHTERREEKKLLTWEIVNEL